MILSCAVEEKRYLGVIQSGLVRILDLAKTAPEQSGLDEISLLLAIKGDNHIPSD